MTAHERWKRLRHRIEWFALEALAGIVPRLSRRACVRAADALGALAFHLDRRGRAVALANLDAALGPLPDRERIARVSYQGFARTMLDLFWSPALDRAGVERWVEVENIGVVQRLQREGRGVMLLTIHKSGFEWTSIAGGFLGFPMVAVAEPFKNAPLEAIFAKLRGISGQRVLAQEGAMIKMLRHVKKGGFCGMLLDLNLPPSQAATVVDAFGMKMCVTLLHAVLAQRGGAALVPVDTETRPDGSCRIIVHEPLVFPPEATIPEITQGCWDFYEPIIRARPEAWMWAYKHFRYRPKAAPAESYPFYANVSGKFEKLMDAG